MTERPNIDGNYIFLLLMWFITLLALLGALLLFRDIRTAATESAPKPAQTFGAVIPNETKAPAPGRFVIPPPPF